MKKLIKNAIECYTNSMMRKNAMVFYENAIRYNPNLGMYLDGEKGWLEKWSQYDSKISPLAYRIFGRYIGHNMDIVPLEICSRLETVLTPHNFMDYYSDKNSYDILFPLGVLPETYFRNIGGAFYGNDYAPLNRSQFQQLVELIPSSKIIVKPTLSSSGKGVKVFMRMNDNFNNNEDVLTYDYLIEKYKKDFIGQEAFMQHSYLSQFNESSVNTIRIVTYRDSLGNIHPLNSILRIGKKNSVVDNAHAGGVFVGIDLYGSLGKYVCDQFGRTQTCFNNIDFESNSFTIPFWYNVINFVVELTKRSVHHNLVAWDVALDTEGKPRLLEMNVGGFSGWLFQFTSGPMFGEYTNDVISTSFKKIKETELHYCFFRR